MNNLNITSRLLQWRPCQYLHFSITFNISPVLSYRLIVGHGVVNNYIYINIRRSIEINEQIMASTLSLPSNKFQITIASSVTTCDLFHQLPFFEAACDTYFASIPSTTFLITGFTVSVFGGQQTPLCQPEKSKLLPAFYDLSVLLQQASP